MKTSMVHQNDPSHIEYHYFALGFTLGANGTSDFSAAGTSQVITLGTLKAGDIVLTQLARVEVRTAAALSPTCTLKVGITGTDDRFIGAGSIKALDTLVQAHATAANNYVYANTSGADVSIIGTITVGSGNVSDITAGEVWICLPIIRKADRAVLHYGSAFGT